MAIRFVNDAAAVVIPPNQSSRKYGQQLVLQQQKYANDQRQLQQENMYDRQKQYMQNAFQLEQEKERRALLGQQALADLNAKQVFGAQKADAAKIAQKQAAEKAEKENIERIKKQQKLDDFDGINSGEFDPKVANRIKELWRRKNEIPIDKNLDEAMRAEESDKVEEELAGLRGNRIQSPSGAELANRNLKHYVPSLQRFATPEELQELKKADPNIEVQVFQDGKMLPGPTPKQGPMTAQEYYGADDAKFEKDLANRIGPLQDKIDDGTLTLEEGQSVRDLAWQQMQDDYNFKQKALGRGQPAQGGQPAMPPQAGQPAAPPAQAPAAPPPVMGMQDLEPTYNADGTTAAPGQPAMPPQAGQQAAPPAQAAPPQTGQPAPPVEGPKEEADRSFVDENGIKWKRVPSALYHGQYTPDTPPKEGMVVTWPGGIRHKWSQNGWIALGKASEAAPVQTPQVDQPASQPELIYNDGIGGNGKVYERMPDGSVREFKNAAKQPIQQADGSLWQQSPEDGAWRVVPPAIQPFRPEQPVLPSRPLQPGEEEGGSSFAPRAPGGMQQPAETLPVDQTGMQPPAQNVWAEVGVPGQQTLEQKPADVATPAKQPTATVVAPDFAKLSKNAANDTDRVVLGKMQDAYKNAKTPEIQDAIKVLVTPGVPASKKALAARALRAAGIDLNKLIPSANADASGLDFSSAGVM